MWTDIKNKIKICERCIKHRATTDNKAPLVNITSGQPLYLVCLDFLSLEKCEGGFQNVLIVTEHFNRFAQAIATMDQSAKTTA